MLFPFAQGRGCVYQCWPNHAHLVPQVYFQALKPGEEASLEYTFQPAPALPPREYILAFTLFYEVCCSLALPIPLCAIQRGVGAVAVHASARAPALYGTSALVWQVYGGIRQGVPCERPARSSTHLGMVRHTIIPACAASCSRSRGQLLLRRAQPQDEYMPQPSSTRPWISLSCPSGLTHRCSLCTSAS